MSQIILDYSQAGLISTALFITRFDINSRADLSAVDTIPLPLGTVFQFITGDGAARINAMAELQAGPADIDDVSEVAPDNYSELTNDKHWQVVAGYLPI